MQPGTAPAANSLIEVALGYSGVHAVWGYRLAHRMWQEPSLRVPARLLSQLVRALTEPVRWLDVERALDERGVTDYVETGPGTVLTNLVKKSLAMEAAGA